MTILTDLDTPIFAAEGIPDDTDPARWTLVIDGLAKAPGEFTLDQIKALPNSRINARLTSVSGWSVRVDWEGALWRDFVKAYPPADRATHALFTSPGGYTTCVPLQRLDHPRVLWAWAVGGEPLEADYGGPLRMVIPPLWGYKSCKWISRLTYTDSMIPGYWETRGYTVDGEIEAGQTMDVNSRQRREIPGGEVVDF